MGDLPIAVIGLGYVGLPLAVEFARHFPVTGFDIEQRRINELHSGHDRTLEVTAGELAEVAPRLQVTTTAADLQDCNVYIVTVPTPIDRFRQPDLTPLMRASETVGGYLTAGDVVVYESTVYPGATEEDCVPVLERCSGLTCNRDFSVGGRGGSRGRVRCSCGCRTQRSRIRRHHPRCWPRPLPRTGCHPPA